MTNDKPQQQESQPQEKRSEPQSQHIRPRIQRKSPKITKKKQDNNDNGIAATVVEIEETRKRMESWVGLGSKNKNETSSFQKTREKEGSANDFSVNNKKNVVVSHENQKPKQQQQNQPVSILKSPKYSSTSKPVTVEASSALASATSIRFGGSATVRADVAPSKDLLATTQQQQQQNTRIANNYIDGMNDGKKYSNIKKNNSSFICKDIVVERDPRIAATKRKSFRQTNKNKDQNDTIQRPSSTGAAHHASIEGYVPTGSGMKAPMELYRSVKKGGDDNVSENTMNRKAPSGENDEDPLVIDSLEGLMRAAGESLPETPDKITDDTKMVEADISFSVMTQDQYENKLPAMKEENEEERKRQLEVFMGKSDIFEDDDDNESIEGALDSDVIDNNDDDDDDDDAVMELLLGSDIDIDDETDSNSTARQPKVRAFTLLWDALTNWMTHDTVAWVKTLRDSHHKENSNGNSNNVNASAMLDNNDNSKIMDTEWSPMVDRSDIGASRCAGVLAMIRLYIGKCMEELNHPLESRRKAVKRLTDIMRTFDYSRENPKLSAGHWRAMACVLLDVVLIETREADSALLRVPPSVAKIGMSKEEFEYLSRKAVLIFV